MRSSHSARFITACMREQPTTAEMVAFAGAIDDWPAAVALAARHRVTAYLQQAITVHDIPVPAVAVAALAQRAREALVQVMALDHQLQRIVVEFARVDLPVIILKGPVLARTLYRDATCRPYGDLDLTVRVPDEPAASAALLRLGLVEVPYDAETARRAHACTTHATAAFHRMFIHAASHSLVELHLDPLQLGLKPTCEAGRWQRARPAPGLGSALMLSPEDQLIQLSVHAHKHGFNRLIWLKDIDLLLRRHGASLDWPLVQQVANSEGVSASVWYALWLAGQLLHTPAPPSLIRRLQPSPLVRVLYRTVWPPGRIGALEGFMRRRSVQFHAAESWVGMLPNLILMGRRGDRAHATLDYVLRR